jgi:hypothetical protein
MFRESGHLPVFQTAAAEIAKATASDTSEEAREIHGKAVELERKFGLWTVTPPEPEDRTGAIWDLLALARRAGEYRVRKK